MNIYDAIHNQIKATSAITDLIGTSDNCRHYTVKAAQGISKPYLVSQIISPHIPEHTMSADSGPRGPRMRFTAWDVTLSGAHALAVVVKNLFMDFSGTMGGGGGITVSRSLLEADIDADFDPTAEVEGLWNIIQEYIIWYEE